MAQQIYANIGGKKKKKGTTKLLIAILCVIGAALIVLAIVGLIVGSDGEEHLQVSQAIAENVQLKQQIDTLNAEIERLNSEIEHLGGELAARPTAEPPQASVEAAASPSPLSDGVSPRGYYD